MAPTSTAADSPIAHIGDTAYWVAFYRAMETARPDAVFRDPFARRLAGEHGEAITDRMPNGRRFAWPMIVRTAVMDEIVLAAVRARGVDVVLNLACGLDARPWRLDLPPALTWVEVDMPAMIEHKRAVLSGETPRCRLEQVQLDLADRPARQALLTRVNGLGQRALVITEGLLVYLSPDDVAALADDLHAQPRLAEWLLDLVSPSLLVMLQKGFGRATAAGGAPLQFAPAENTAFFAPHGWAEAEYRNTWQEARRLRRTPPGAWFYQLMSLFASAKRKAEFARFAGIVRLDRRP